MSDSKRDRTPKRSDYLRKKANPELVCRPAEFEVLVRLERSLELRPRGRTRATAT